MTLPEGVIAVRLHQTANATRCDAERHNLERILRKLDSPERA
jgi:hypothetical protein